MTSLSRRLEGTPMAAKKRKTASRGGGPSRQERRQAFQAHIKKEYKDTGLIMRGDEYEAPFMVRRIPTGILELDLALNGGFPCGGVSEIIGAESSGKTTLLNQVFSYQQQILGKEAMLGIAMTEQPFDKGHAKFNCGVNIAIHPKEIDAIEATLKRKLTKEERAIMGSQTGEFDEFAAGTVEALYDMLLDAVASRTYHVLGLDSWGSILTEAEEGSNMQDKMYAGGGGANVNASWARRLSPEFVVPKDGNRNYTALIGINQYRMKMNANPKAGAMKQMSVQGGYALKHIKLVSIFLESFDLWEETSGKRKRIGKKIKWTVMKGKAGCHDGGTGEYEIRYGIGIDILREHLMAGLLRGLIVSKGSWYYLIDPSDDSEIFKAQGKDAFLDLLKNEDGALEWLRDSVIDYEVREKGASFIPPR
jgi:RecA/RadA recombinase